MKNIDGSLIKDAEEKHLGLLPFLLLLILFPVFIVGKLLERISRGRYCRISDRDYAILQRKMQRKKAREKKGIRR